MQGLSYTVKEKLNVIYPFEFPIPIGENVLNMKGTPDKGNCVIPSGSRHPRT